MTNDELPGKMVTKALGRLILSLPAIIHVPQETCICALLHRRYYAPQTQCLIGTDLSSVPARHSVEHFKHLMIQSGYF